MSSDYFKSDAEQQSMLDKSTWREKRKAPRPAPRITPSRIRTMGQLERFCEDDLSLTGGGWDLRPSRTVTLLVRSYHANAETQNRDNTRYGSVVCLETTPSIWIQA